MAKQNRVRITGLTGRRPAMTGGYPTDFAGLGGKILAVREDESGVEATDEAIIIPRSGTAAAMAAVVLEDGEFGYELTDGAVSAIIGPGDGVAAWSTLPSASLGASAALPPYTITTTTGQTSVLANIDLSTYLTARGLMEIEFQILMSGKAEYNFFGARYLAYIYRDDGGTYDIHVGIENIGTIHNQDMTEGTITPEMNAGNFFRVVVANGVGPSKNWLLKVLNLDVVVFPD